MFVNWKTNVLTKAENALLRQRTPWPLKELAWRAISFVTHCGQSNPISFALRPVASHRHLRTGVGIYIAVAAVMISYLQPLPSQAENIGGVPAITVAPEGEATLATKDGTQLPISDFTISQGFWLLHSGLDMASHIGEPVRPIMAGVVTKAENNWYGYGNLVVISHGSEFESWYAHLSKINVVLGQTVTQETIIGEVGTTGHSTGPHLHLEIHEDGVPVNPATVLGIKN
jgi:murein DD-endopeptidase MepM/ murein hydrolase activator NlpD